MCITVAMHGSYELFIYPLQLPEITFVLCSSSCAFLTSHNPAGLVITESLDEKLGLR